MWYDARNDDGLLGAAWATLFFAAWVTEMLLLTVTDDEDGVIEYRVELYADDDEIATVYEGTAPTIAAAKAICEIIAVEV